MKKLLGLLMAVLCCATVQAQNVNGQIIASQYGQWTVQGYAPNSYQFAPTSCRVQGGSSYFFAFAPGTPVKIVDGNPSLTEIVSPTSVINSNVTCAVSIAPLNNHQLPYYLTSGTGGLQESLNANVAAPQKNTIILDATWYSLVGSSNAAAVIAAAQGSTQLGLVDQTQVPYVWYQWNGTQYTPVALGGTCTSNSCVTSLNSLQGAVGLQQGSNITITPSGQNLVIASTGGGGGGTLGGPFNSARYGSATGTAVSPSPSLYQVDNTTTLSQMNALVASLGGQYPSAGGSPYVGLGTILIPDGLNFTGFFNLISQSGNGNSGVGVFDIRTGVHTTPLSQYGVVGGAGSPGCARTQGNYQFTLGSTTVTPIGTSFVASDVGSTIVVVGTVAGVPTRFSPTISAFNLATGTVTISTPSPFTSSGGATVGFLNTGNFQNAMNGLTVGTNSTLVGQIPSACPILTDTISWNNGQSLMGDSPAAANILDMPGDDLLQAPDANGAGSVTRGGLRFGNVTLTLDTRIDATKTWNDVNSAGATTVHQPLYRPLGELTEPANDPLAPGWAQGTGPYNGGAQNGTASITSGSAVMCVPTSYFSRLTVGHQLVFRDTPTVFKTTVSTLTGSGCAGGFSAATMANTAPATIAQAEWVDTTSIQNLAIALPAGPMNYPVTITVANSTTPVPSFESNVAGHGHIKIGSEEYDYQGGNNSIAVAGPYTFTLRSGPATTAGWGVGTAVVPMNPCPARYEQPWPVTPTINSGDSTPSGAGYFPAFCAGNAAISMPQVNGNTHVGTGFVDSYLQNIIVNTYGGPPNSNSGTCYYVGGNNASYGTTYDGMQCTNTQYGIVQGPASSGQHGIATASPTGDGNHYVNLSLRNSVNMVLDQFQNSTVHRVDAYTTAFSQYDASAIGSYTALLMSNTFDEQNGNIVSAVNDCEVNNFNAEPENGSHIEVPVYAEIDAYACQFNDDSFEGALSYLGGTQNKITNGQLSGLAAGPVIDYGSQNVVEDTINTNVGVVSNVFGTGSYLEWGNYGRNGSYSANGNGPVIAGAIGTRDGYDGDDSSYALTGNFVKPYRNIKAGYISSEEWASTGMGTKYLDPTELKQGSYTSCAISPTLACNAAGFNGFNGGILIGNGDRIQPEPYVLYANMKMASGTAVPNVYIRAAANGYATCAAPGTVAQYQPNLTTTWQTFAFKTDFSSYAGCTLSFSFGGGTGTGTMELGATQFLPIAQVSHTPIATYTAGAACPTWAVAGDDLGIDSSNQYFCGASSTIIAQAISGSGGGISTLTGDVTGSGTGSVSTTVKSIGGGSLLSSLPAGPLCNNGSAGQGVICTNVAVSGAVSGTSITGGTLIGGVYNVPSAASSVFNITIGNSQYLLLGQNTTTTLVAGSSGGQVVTFDVCENATGGYTFAWPTNFLFFPAISYTASTCTVVTGYWDGAYVWAASTFINPMNTLGDTMYQTAIGPTRLAGSIATQPSFLQQIGTGTVSAAPTWNTSTGSGAVVLAASPTVTGTLAVTGNVTVTGTITATGTGGACTQLGNAQICSGTGAPVTTCGTAPVGSGSLWMRTDGAASTSLYSCAGTTWTAVTVP